MSFIFERYTPPRVRRKSKKPRTDLLGKLKPGDVYTVIGYATRQRARQMIIKRLKKHPNELYSWAETPTGDYAIRKDL